MAPGGLVKELQRLAILSQRHRRRNATAPAWRLEKVKEAKLREQIENCKLYAPIDGVVFHYNNPNAPPGQRPNIEEGATVRERQLIFRIADPGEFRVNAKVHESLVDRIKRGQRARIRVDAFPEEVISGVVEAVAPRPDPGSFFRSDHKVYSTNIRIEGRPPSLRTGMTALAEIVVGELDDVLTVPTRAVLHSDGKDRVAVRTPGGEFDWREVTLGAYGGDLVEVKEGLKAGEAVVLDPTALSSEEERRAKLGPPAKPATVPPMSP